MKDIRYNFVSHSGLSNGCVGLVDYGCSAHYLGEMGDVFKKKQTKTMGKVESNFLNNRALRTPVGKNEKKDSPRKKTFWRYVPRTQKKKKNPQGKAEKRRSMGLVGMWGQRAGEGQYGK